MHLCSINVCDNAQGPNGGCLAHVATGCWTALEVGSLSVDKFLKYVWKFQDERLILRLEATTKKRKKSKLHEMSSCDKWKNLLDAR